MPKAKPSPLGFPKPHYLAFVSATPCACGYDWLRPAIVMDEDADELPIVDICARCGRDPSAPHAKSAQLVTPPEKP